MTQTEIANALTTKEYRVLRISRGRLDCGSESVPVIVVDRLQNPSWGLLPALMFVGIFTLVGYIYSLFGMGL